MIDTAAEHALAAGDLDEAERVIGLASGRALQDGQLATVLDWLNSLPDGRLRANSELATRKGWVLCLMGQREAAEVFAARAEAGLPSGTPLAHQGELLTLQAYLAGQRGDNADALRLAQQAIPMLDQADPLQRTFQYAALLSLGHAQRGIGDMQAAIDAFHQVASRAQAYGDDLATMGALEELSWLLLRHGRRAEAAARCRQAIDRCERATRGPLPMLAMAYIVLATMCYEANDLAQANQHVRQGSELCRQLMMPPITLRGKILLSRLLLAAGNPRMATATIEDARQTAGQMGLPRYTRLVETAAADIHLLQGHIALAAQWAETAHLSVADAASAADEAQYLVYARLLIAQGRLDEAVLLLSDLARSVQERERYGSLINIHILQARVEQALGHEPEALDDLRRALNLAAPRGYDRVFLDAGSSIAQLLPLLRPVAPEMVDRLLKSLAASSRQWAERAASLLDPLSARELEVLRLVAAGLSNREAAQALFVTEETIKKHLSHVYDKLAVKNRTQAIARAKQNGWLA